MPWWPKHLASSRSFSLSSVISSSWGQFHQNTLTRSSYMIELADVKLIFHLYVNAQLWQNLLISLCLKYTLLLCSDMQTACAKKGSTILLAQKLPLVLRKMLVKLIPDLLHWPPSGSVIPRFIFYRFNAKKIEKKFIFTRKNMVKWKVKYDMFDPYVLLVCLSHILSRLKNGMS